MASIPPDYQTVVVLPLGNALNPTQAITLTATVVQAVTIVGLEGSFVTPTSHGSTHTSAGGDPVPLASQGVTGLLQALPAAGGGSGQQQVTYLRGDNTFQTGLLVPLLSTIPSGSGSQTETWLRGDDTWQQIPDGHQYRYIRQRHCDAPLGLSDPSIVTGTGASISQVTPSTTSLNHPGIWQLTSGTSNNGVAAIYAGLSGTNDFSLSVFSRFAARAVIKSGTLPSGAVGSATFGQFCMGFTDTAPGSQPAVANNIIWRFAPSVSANWSLLIGNGSTQADNVSSVVVSANTWYDFQIYVDQNGVLARCNIWAAGVLPTLLQSSFITANVPAVSANMNFQIWNINGTAGTTSHPLAVDLYELVGEIQGRIFRGDHLLTQF
jgi:hypothetical protein